MIDFDFSQDCCGCGACSNICPTGAIQMVPGEGDFLYPHVNMTMCIECKKCESVCPHLNPPGREPLTQSKAEAWLYASRDSVAKQNSASGAAAYELARFILREDGVVAGCAWDEALCAKHIMIDDLSALRMLQGSKYVQSESGNIYQAALNALKIGKHVLFTGTPCQVTAMRRIAICAGKDIQDGLITAAVICHGVSAPLAWETYKRWLEKKQGSKLTDVNFRDKSKKGYRSSYCRYTFASGASAYLPTFLPTSLPSYIEATLVYNLAIRKSCANCDCKGINNACDLILGDWYAAYKGEGSMGTSCVIACTEKGKWLVAQALQSLRPLNLEQVVAQNGLLVNSTSLGEKRDEFLTALDERIWEDIERFYPRKRKIKKMLVKTGTYGIFKKIKSMIKS